MISSTRNKHVAAAAKLAKRALRDGAGRFLVEGAQPVREALDAGAVESVYFTPGPAGAPHPLALRARELAVRAESVSEAVMAHLTSTVTPQGILAVARYVDVALDQIPHRGVVPVLVAVRDPGNAGTILRSADAAGASGVVFSESSVDVYNPKAVRASAGSVFHLPVVRDAPLEETVRHLRHAGMRVLAAAADGEATVYETDLTVPTAVLFGNEAWGLPPEAAALADATVRVPIIGAAESLNLAAAATVVLFEAARQREAPAGDRTGMLVQFVSGAAHNIRSPLTILKGFAQTLARSWERLRDDQRRDLLNGMAFESERVAQTVKMIVDGARLEEGALQLSPERRSLGDSVDWLARLFGGGRDYPEVVATGEAEAFVDADRLQYVLLSVYDAAVWWGPEGPVEVRMRQEEGSAVMEVHRGGDDGPTDADIARMLDEPRPERGKPSLHIVRRVVEAHGGAVECRGGDGVTFRIAFPA